MRATLGPRRPGPQAAAAESAPATPRAREPSAVFKTRHAAQVHFVGIGGIGMSGIAEVLLNLGYRVSGSDLKESEITRRLAGAGRAASSYGHRAENVARRRRGGHLLGGARDNPEVVEAARRGRSRSSPAPRCWPS